MSMLTLFVDASWCPETHAAGWGAWAKRDDWQRGRTFGAPFKAAMRTIGDAEIAGIANALHQLAGWDALAGVRSVMVQCDCIQALETLVRLGGAQVSNHADGARIWPRLKRGIYTRVEQAAALRIRELLGERTLVVRHVRGHQAGGSRQWVNRECDRLAKRGMRDARARVREAAA